MTRNISKSKGIRGYRGEKGDAFKYSDFTPEQLADLKGAKGDKGDVPSVAFRIDEEGNLYYESDGILVDKEYVDSNNLATKEYVLSLVLEISNKVAKTPHIITLYKDKWTLVEENKWHQEIEVPYTTEHSMVDFMPTDAQLNYLVQNGILLSTENDGGRVVAVCKGTLLSDDLTIKVTVSEVVVSE